MRRKMAAERRFHPYEALQNGRQGGKPGFQLLA